ncbi:MAG: hypothetical protein ACYCTE_05695 [Acidimicrobiales bacterium]
MEIEGLLAIEDGASSRGVRTRVESFLAPWARGGAIDHGSAS